MLDVDVFAVDVCCYGYDLFEALLRQPSLTERNLLAFPSLVLRRGVGASLKIVVLMYAVQI